MRKMVVGVRSVRSASSINIIAVMVIGKQYSALHQSRYRRPPVQAPELPDLRSSSDIAWLAWKPYHDKGVKLKHVIIWSVTNGLAHRLMAAALDGTSDEPLKDTEKTLQPYPWVGWTANQNSGSLVLGILCRAP
jgi:hypothetical protein